MWSLIPRLACPAFMTMPRLAVRSVQSRKGRGCLSYSRRSACCGRPAAGPDGADELALCLGRTQPHKPLIELLAVASKYGHIGTNVARPVIFVPKISDSTGCNTDEKLGHFGCFGPRALGRGGSRNGQRLHQGGDRGRRGRSLCPSSRCTRRAAGSLIGRHYAHKHTRRILRAEIESTTRRSSRAGSGSTSTGSI